MVLQRDAHLVLGDRKKVADRVAVDSRADVDHLLFGGIVFAEVDREPGFRWVFCCRAPLEGDTVDRLLCYADVNKGVLFGRQDGSRQREGERGIEGADVNCDADRGVSNEVVGPAGVEPSV